jgi:hypothetical protein
MFGFNLERIPGVGVGAGVPAAPADERVVVDEEHAASHTTGASASARETVLFTRPPMADNGFIENYSIRVATRIEPRVGKP